MTTNSIPNTPATVYLDPMDENDQKTETGSMNTASRTRSVTPKSASTVAEDDIAVLDAALESLGFY